MLRVWLTCFLGFGTRRVPMETFYYEAYNRPNVRLVDLLETPIERVTADGITTSQEELKFDMLIYATGFDAGKSLEHINSMPFRDGPGPCTNRAHSNWSFRRHRLPRNRQPQPPRRVERRTQNLPRTDRRALPKHVHVHGSSPSIRQYPT